MGNENDFFKLREEIDREINELRTAIINSDVLDILNKSLSMFFKESIGKITESETKDSGIYLRIIEYVQSVAVSEHEYVERCDKEIIFEDIQCMVTELYEKIDEYHIARSVFMLGEDPEFNIDADYVFVEAQKMKSVVRGNRHTNHELINLRELLTPNEDMLVEKFGIGLDELLFGLYKLKKSFENYNGIKNYSMLNILKITGLPEELIDCLSWCEGENVEFFNNGLYSGWPIKTLPVEDKPFIKMNGKYYCFNPYFFDSLYRALYKAITDGNKKNIDIWLKRKNKVTEDLTFRYFESILKNAEIYRNVEYQQIPGDKNTWCECDGIIIVDDHLIVVEVKSGNVRSNLITEDFSTYTDSIKELILEPYEQAIRLLKYINSRDEVSLFNGYRKKDHKKKFYRVIKNINRNNIRNVTVCCVTLDSFRSISPKPQILKPIGIEFNEFPVWSITIDDLRVFSDVFENHIMFINYLENRMKAALVDNMLLNDEMEHLGMYFKYVNYSKFEKVMGNKTIIGSNERSVVDEYFHNIYNNLNTNKPNILLPNRIDEMVNWILYNKKTDYMRVANCLIDMDFEFGEFLSESINNKLKYNINLGNNNPIRVPWHSDMFIFCNVDGDDIINDIDLKGYVLENMNEKAGNIALAMCIIYSERGKIVNISYEFISHYDSTNVNKNAFDTLDERLTNKKIDSYKKERGIKKISRNDDCFCGSGIKYKKCCGK